VLSTLPRIKKIINNPFKTPVRNAGGFLIYKVKEMKEDKEIGELEDIFKTEEFKSLSKLQRIWIRIKVAFIQTISSL
jgi:hypothetical protein